MRALADAGQDLAYAWRTLRRSPLFALAVTLTLAVGIGANATVLGVIDRAFLRELPVPHPERVLLISSGDTRAGAQRRSIAPSSFPDYLDLRSRVEGVSGLAAFAPRSLTLGGDLAGREVWGALVTANYFELLGARAERGRWIAPDEDQPRGAHPVVVISHTLWQTRFGGDEHIVGRELAIGDGRFAIIGVAPPGFTGVLGEPRTDLWLPYTMQAQASGSEYLYDFRDARLAFIVGRLAPGAGLPLVRASLDRAALDLRATYPELDGSLRFGVQLHDRLVPIEQAPFAFVSLLLVWAMVLLLHLVACSNVASLILARAAARRQDLGIRLCLGASPRRVLTHTLAEPALLASLGAAGGLIVARWLTLLITRMQFLSAMDPGLDARVVAIVALTAAATVLAFGLAPALQAARSDPLALLGGASGARPAGRRGDATPLLVAGQVAVSLVLLANAAVLLRTFERQARGDPGFDASHLAVVSVTLHDRRQLRRDWTPLGEMTARIGRLPGVTGVAAADGAPLYRAGWLDEVLVAGHEYGDGESRMLSVQTIGPGYLATIGARLVAGREFDASDRGGASGSPGFDAVVVNEAMARRYWPGQDPIGKLVAFRHRGSATVVGVVRDVHDISLSAITPRAYFPLLEWRMNPGFEVLVRTSGDPAALLGPLRAAVGTWSLPTEPPAARTMDEVVADAAAVSRAGGVGLAIAAVIALLLTTIGLYGLVASWVAQRTREIGIRLALGAQAADVHRLLLGGAGRLVGTGSLAGLAAAAGVIRIERGWWGPSVALEILPLLAAVLVLAAAAGLAAYFPARRAAALDPAMVLHAM
jgi:predicted permease